MSRALPRPAARPLAAPAVALALGLALTGCGAGFEAQTYQERTVADASNDAAGAIAVRNVHVVAPAEASGHPAGSDVALELVLANDGGEDDRLVEVTTDAAASVQLLQDGTPVDSIPLTALGTTGTSTGALLQGLTRDLRAGEYVELTFRFDRNGSTTVQVPVATSEEYDYERERSGNFHPPGSEHGEEGEGGLSEAGEQTEQPH